jgi:hypothetical protein
LGWPSQVKIASLYDFFSPILLLHMWKLFRRNEIFPFFSLLLCWLGVHCGIYKGSYNVSTVSYLNSPPPPLPFRKIHPSVPYFQLPIRINDRIHELMKRSKKLIIISKKLASEVNFAYSYRIGMYLGIQIVHIQSLRLSVVPSLVCIRIIWRDCGSLYWWTPFLEFLMLKVWSRASNLPF